MTASSPRGGEASLYDSKCGLRSEGVVGKDSVSADGGMRAISAGSERVSGAVEAREADERERRAEGACDAAALVQTGWRGSGAHSSITLEALKSHKFRQSTSSRLAILISRKSRDEEQKRRQPIANHASIYSVPDSVSILPPSRPSSETLPTNESIPPCARPRRACRVLRAAPRST